MQSVRYTLSIALFAAVVFGSAVPLPAAPWPQWRGPMGNGVSEEKNPPVAWNADEGVVWQQTIPGQGWSSPVVWGNHVYLTSSESDERLLVLAVNRANGTTAWRKAVDTYSGIRLASRQISCHFTVAFIMSACLIS